MTDATAGRQLGEALDDALRAVHGATESLQLAAAEARRVALGPPSPPELTKTQAARYLQMGEDKLVRLLRRREIRKARRWGARNEWRVPLDALDEWRDREYKREAARLRPVDLDDRRAS